MEDKRVFAAYSQKTKPSELIFYDFKNFSKIRTIDIQSQHNIYGQLLIDSHTKEVLLNLINAHSLNREIRVFDHTGEEGESWSFIDDRNSYLLIHSDFSHALFADREENTLYKFYKNTGDFEDILEIDGIWHSVITPAGLVVQKRSRFAAGSHEIKLYAPSSSGP